MRLHDMVLASHARAGVLNFAKLHEHGPVARSKVRRSVTNAATSAFAMAGRRLSGRARTRAGYGGCVNRAAWHVMHACGEQQCVANCLHRIQQWYALSRGIWHANATGWVQ